MAASSAALSFETRSATFVGDLAKVLYSINFFNSEIFVNNYFKLKLIMKKDCLYCL